MTGSTVTAGPGAPAANSDVDGDVQSNQPLYLTFSPGLTSLTEAKKQKRKSNVYKVSGINILNRNSVDSKTALERLHRRRENHNFVERRRRDNINHTITTLSTLIPSCTEEGAKLNKGSILQMAVEYIRDLRDTNELLAAENRSLGGSGLVTLPERSPLPSGLSTAQHSQDEDEDVPLSSTAASSPAASAQRSARKRSCSHGNAARALPEKRQTLAPPATLMPPPPMSTPHSPQPMLASGSSSGTHTPLPPIGAIVSAPRPPAQSMPSSPSLRPRLPVRSSTGAVRTHVPSFNSHPFFSDVSSIRHHMQPPQASRALPPLSAQHSPRCVQPLPTLPSLQNTPAMRPAHGSAFDGSDLPPISVAMHGEARHSRHISPASRHMAPAPIQLAPVSRQTSPALVQTSPASVHLAPVSRQTSPAAVQLAPVSTQTSPASIHMAPGYSQR